MNVTMRTRPVKSLGRHQLISQLAGLRKKLASQFEVPCCDPAQAHAALNEVVACSCSVQDSRMGSCQDSTHLLKLANCFFEKRKAHQSINSWFTF